MRSHLPHGKGDTNLCTRGVLVLNNYGPTIYKALGYGTYDQLRFQAGWITVAVFATAFAATIIDKVGRRPLAITAFIGTSVCLSIEAAIVAEFATKGTNKAGLAVGVAATYVFAGFYGIGIDVVSIVLYPELFQNHIRSKGMAICIATNALTDLVYLVASPTAFKNIGWKFYLVSGMFLRMIFADHLHLVIHHPHGLWRDYHCHIVTRDQRCSP